MALNIAAIGRYLTGTIPNHTSANDKAGIFPECRDQLDVAFKHYSLGLASGATQPLGTSDEGDIRLLEIFPHPTGSGRIRGALHHYCFLVPARRISYRALSYVWGDQDEDRLIVIDGKGFLVTENLQTILWRLRQTDRSVYVWIDAICIYQKMKQEKEVQVGMMHDIYSTADEVVVYLGEHANNSEMVVDFAETVMTKLMAVHDSCPDVGITEELLEAFGLPPASHPGWKALRDVFGRPWFQRKWIVQEYTLAKLVTCVLGNISFNFELLVLVHKFCLNHKLNQIYNSPRPRLTIPHVHPFTMLITIRGEIRHNFDNDPKAEVKTLPWLLAATSYAQVSQNPHDHIYALLGMHQVSGTLLGLPYPVVDYDRSVEDVFIDYACIDDWKTSNADESLLELASQRKNYNLPSWVPDWSRSTSLRYVLDPGPRSGKGASNGVGRSGFVFRRAAKSLTVQAKIIDSITQVVSLGRAESGWSAEWEKMSRQWYDYVEYLRGMANCTTSKGYKILAADGCRAGDRLVVILGERVPFVVRPRGANWELIGCAYYSDLMEGQALREYGKFYDGNDGLRSLTLV